MTRPALLVALLAVFGPGPAPAQNDTPLLQPPQVNELCGRLSQLMEAGGVAVPDLQRASVPVIENTRQNCVQLRASPGRGDLTYSLIVNLKAYLALSDSVPKPFPFPEAAQKQLTELRDDTTRLEAHFRALMQSSDARFTNPDPAELKRYAEENRKLRPPVTGRPRVVFFGDSITDFWRLNEYFPDRDYINRGIAGQTTGQMVQRVKQDVIDLHPEAVVILAGTNDLARAVPVAAIEDNLEIIAELAAAKKIKVVFGSLTPVSDYHKEQDPSFERSKLRPAAFIVNLNEWLQKHSMQTGYGFVDYYAAAVDSTGQMKEDLADDGLHPNAKGYRVMAPLVTAALGKVLGATPAPAPPAEKPKRRLFPSLTK